MNIKQVIEYLEDSKCINKEIAGHEEFHNYVLDLAIKVLKKRISEKPISHMVGDFNYMYYCKKCSGSVCKDDNYCRICGQKLDWD